MTLFILNMVSVSMVMMAAVVLIVLRERTETQLILAGITLEAVVALGSLIWITPDELGMQFLAMRAIGRTIEAIIMWYVIIVQVRGIQRSTLEPSAADALHQKLETLEKKVDENIKPIGDDDHAITH